MSDEAKSCEQCDVPLDPEDLAATRRVGLGVAAGASSNEITRAFRVLCRALHPDHGGDRQRFETVVASDYFVIARV